MKFIIAVEPGTDETAFGTVVPGLPGCFSAGDTLDEAVDNTREAIELWVESVIEAGGKIPAQDTLQNYQMDKEYLGWIWAMVEAPVERYFGPAEKINITLPKLVLAQVDEFAKARNESRSGFLARVAMETIRRAS